MRASTVAALTLALGAAAAATATAACTAIFGVDGDYRLAPGDDASAEGGGAATDGPGVGTEAAPGGDAPSPTGADAAIEAGPVVAVAAGRFYTCARFAGGVARCWGQNTDGEFGDGLSNMSSAVPVAAMGAGIQSLYAGPGDTCAVVTGGGACAGQGGEGQLGDGLVDADSPVPVATGALPAAPTAFAMGVHFGCAIVAGGDVYCFGSGPLGELGNGAAGDSATPVKVSLGGAQAAAIAGTWQHVCAVTTSGAVYCWGDDSLGQLGNGAVVDAGVPTPALVSLSAPAFEIAAGSGHSCAIVGQGSGNGVWCWGDNSGGELGDGTGTSSTTPVHVAGISGVAHLSAGSSHTCVALAYGGGVACWGRGGSGQLGSGGTKDALSPVMVSNIGGAPESLAAGGFHTCALVASPHVLCWGANDFGQLGNDDPMGTQQNAPVAVQW